VSSLAVLLVEPPPELSLGTKDPRLYGGDDGGGRVGVQEAGEGGGEGGRGQRGGGVAGRQLLLVLGQVLLTLPGSKG
jgi:hypothetical protein